MSTIVPTCWLVATHAQRVRSFNKMTAECESSASGSSASSKKEGCLLKVL